MAVSSWDDDIDVSEDGEVGPSLDTEAGQDAWIEFLLTQNEDDDWAKVQVVQEGDNMIARCRWSDGREEIYVLEVKRSFEVVRKAPPGEEN
jgi:hypothetical protein